jgi:uncharacterized protein (DUF362 family)/NAD-dependent dihydropyrimidine dehydrogenase PreA subunit
MSRIERVAVRDGLTYDRHSLVDALGEMVDAVGGWPDSMGPGSRVLLKVNMLAAKRPDRAITTHPQVVAALARLLQDRGCRVAVGDSPGGAVKGVQRYWDRCGFSAVAGEMGLELVNFERAGSEERRVRGFTYHIARPVFEYDSVVNMCKLKTHMYCRMTCAVKNTFGVVPGLGKAMLHAHAVRPRDLAGRIVDIYGQVRFDLVVMDAVLAMDGKGPSTDGHPRSDGVMAVATDSVAMDMIASEMVGMEAHEWGTTRAAMEAGAAPDRDLIRVDGWHEFEDFRVPSNRLYNMVPPFLGSLVRPLLRRAPKSNERCTGCGFCARSCPAGAITVSGGRARMSSRKCILCLCCHELCPENAVEVRTPLRR